MTDLPDHDNTMKWWKKFKKWYKERPSHRWGTWFAVLMVPTIFVAWGRWDYITHKHQNESLRNQVTDLEKSITRKDAEIQQLLTEIQPYKNLALQKFGSMDADSMGKLLVVLTNLDAKVAGLEQRLRIASSEETHAKKMADLFFREPPILYSNTNRVYNAIRSNHLAHTFITLAHAPIQNTLKVAYVDDLGNAMELPAAFPNKNIAQINWARSQELFRTTSGWFYVSYTRDASETNLFGRVIGDSIDPDGQVRFHTIMTK